jgi:signal transduction histidine kinase
VEVKIDPGLPALRADEDALVTVLVNLLDNAGKFTPEEKRIGLRAYRGAGPRPALARGRSGTCPTVCFAVDDNGIGIAPRERKKIFRRFYQVDRRLSRPTGGCGLGLSIVEFIVKAHGGKVEVTSRPGAGSTFTVTL